MPATGSSTAASIELVGGHVAVDLVNTVSWRLDPDQRRDNLSDPAALAEWLPRVGVVDARQAHELLTEPSGSRTRSTRALADVRVLREQLHGMFDRIAGGGETLDALAAPPELNWRLAAAVAHGELRGSPMRWQLTVREPSDIPRLLALEALDLLESPRLRLLRGCQDPRCGWLFVDGSRSHTRRWCSSLDCGNRDRARRHYARHRSASST